MINCKGCQACCCRLIGDVKPELDRGDKACKYLTDDFKCAIYEHRPLICNTDRLYELFYKDLMPREEYDKLNQESCCKLRTNYSRKVEGEFK